jgi:hypothetical protein
MKRQKSTKPKGNEDNNSKEIRMKKGNINMVARGKSS